MNNRPNFPQIKFRSTTNQDFKAKLTCTQRVFENKLHKNQLTVLYNLTFESIIKNSK